MNRLVPQHFHAYDPRLPRRLLVLGGLACLALAGWAVRNAVARVEPFAWARAGVALALAVLFALSFLRLRPREGWGVLLTPQGVRVSPPGGRGAASELDWELLQSLERNGRSRGRLVLRLEGGGRLVLPRHLFGSRAAFDLLARELEERMPASPFDS
jgi:hypothetical protein